VASEISLEARTMHRSTPQSRPASGPFRAPP
jgi:hypothetical protein